MRPKKIVFIHPDLGIGGAERSMIDAALALKSQGHLVQFVTSHHDSSHCFAETKDGTLKVTAVGDWLPRKIFNRFYALCAYIRMIYAALYLVLFSSIEYDVIICDQISACIPFLRLKKTRIIFYCHFPDMLLTKRASFTKRLYRLPIDFLEERTTGMADCVLVNSKFTGGVFSSTFKSLRHIQPEVLYPIPDFAALDKPADPPTPDLMPRRASSTFLSINRYERKKNLKLAIEAFAALMEKAPDADVQLIMAGGYDPRVTENVEYYKELNEFAKEVKLDDRITFLRSINAAQKRTLLKYSNCLIYTPENEHFGIVPIEAMYMECPVIAMRSGGPLETVNDGITGFLCQSNGDDVSDAMLKCVKDSPLFKTLGRQGRRRVLTKFSFGEFTHRLDNIVMGLTDTDNKTSTN